MEAAIKALFLKDPIRARISINFVLLFVVLFVSSLYSLSQHHSKPKYHLQSGNLPRGENLASNPARSFGKKYFG